MLTSIQKLLSTLDEHGIHYCHWKSNAHLDDAINGDTDLDMLFDSSQRSELEIVFGLCGLKRFRSTTQMQYNGIEDYIGFDKKTAKIWHVHTHYRMTLGEKHLKGYTVTPWSRTLLKDRVQDEHGIWISEASEEYILLLCRIALKLRWRDIGRKVGKDDKNELKWLHERVKRERLNVATDKLVGQKSKNLILALYNKGIKKKSQLFVLQKALRKELKPYTAYSRFGSWFTRTKRELFWFYGGVKRCLGFRSFTPNRRISPSGGLVVALLGCDGAGKSTTLSYIRNEFNKKIDTTSIYYGSGDGSSSLLRKPMKIFAKKIGGKGIGISVEQAYKQKKVTLKARMYHISKVLWAVALANEKKGKQRKMLKARNNGMLVITDRYPQSDFPGAGDGPLLFRYRAGKGLTKKIADWEQHVYNEFKYNPPDIAIKLVVSTDIAIKRKPEMTVEEIEHKQYIVRSMNIAEENVVIDTSNSFEITRGEIMDEIWKLI